MSKPFISLSALSIATKISVGLLAATLVADQSRHLKAMPFEIGDPSHNWWMIPAFWSGLLAPGFYLFALWAASDVFDRMDKGDAFGPAMVKGLREVGSNLIYGAAAAIFIAPSLVFLVDTGFNRLSGLKYHFEIESLTIGLIGFVLYLLAKQGQALKSELDQIV
jgi:hypothetical protein